MRKVVVNEFLTLDGVAQAPGGAEEDTDGGFAHGGWHMQYMEDEPTQQWVLESILEAGGFLLGRRTYEIFAAFWPNAPEEAGGKPLNDATKYVASRGTPLLTWDRSVQIEGDVAEGVARLKQEDGPELQVHGSGGLIQTLMANGLIDQYRLWVFPVVLGTGKRLFADGAIPSALHLTDSTVSTTGVVIGTYEPAGEVQTGSFA